MSILHGGVPAELDRAYEGLAPRELWRHFSALNRLPRPSGHEQRARAYVQWVAESHGATWQCDDAGNIVVRAGPRDIGDAGRAVAVQSHLDMVCETDEGRQHDCYNDPITPRREGDSIFAHGTTLGADNGIGVAAALALLTTPGLRHGALELLFTVDEERGLRGALALDPALLSAPFLINLDSEDADRLVIGSAGAHEIAIRLAIVRAPAPGCSGRSIAIGGLRGGHSAIDIGKRRANSLKLLARVVAAAHAAGDVRLAAFEGGNARNAIPRTASAEIVVATGDAERCDAATAGARAELLAEWAADEPDLTIEIQATAASGEPLVPAGAGALLGVVGHLPQGVLSALKGRPHDVLTSINLARARTHADDVELLLTSRSVSEHEQRTVAAEIDELCAVFGADVRNTSIYPPWSPSTAGGELLSAARELYEVVNGRPASVGVVHCGLECGVIAGRVPGMQAISFGPLVSDAHSPLEHVDASTVPAMWALLVKLLERLAAG